MTNITTLNQSLTLTNDGYYQLKSGASTASGSATSTSSATTAAQTAATIQQSFLLSLSAEAQSYLANAGLTTSSNSNALTSSTSVASDFTLSTSQQKLLDQIIQSYAGQPYTQDTFDALQDDLKDAGLSPDQLAQRAQAKAFNPTTSLISALFGTVDPSSGQANADYTQAKSHYLQSIQTAFANVASTVSTPDSTTV